MGLSPQNLERMRVRRDCAKNVLSFFKDKKPVKSPNNPFAFVSSARQDAFYDLREETGGSALAGARLALHTGLGNCDEKGKIVLTGLMGNPQLTLARGHHVRLCAGVDYDHVFVVISSQHWFYEFHRNFTIEQIGVDGIVIDGWTEDWYFPNITKWDALKHPHYWHTPNPRQEWVRHKVKTCQIEAYNTPPD